MRRMRLLFLFFLLLSFSPASSLRADETRNPAILGCGNWEFVFSPNPNSGPVFFGAAAVPDTVELWSVGSYVFNYWQTLVERWDGTTWQIVTSPNYQNANHYLYGVGAIGPNDVWAVGRYEPQGGGSRTLVLHWNGTSWSIVPSPKAAVYNGLYAVAAASATDVWAVGYYYSNSAQRTLIEHWDGTSWSIVSSPNVGAHDNLLRAISVVPNSQIVWAVGYYYRDDGNPSTLTQRWDSTAWSVVASPDGSTRENYLSGVSGTGPNDVWAVGYYNTPTGLYLSLTEHWDGNSWQILPSPSLSSSLTALIAVSSISTTDVWAVGTYYGPSAQLTLAEHWNGNSWQVFNTPNTAGTINGAINEFNSVTNVPGMGVWAVGDYEVRDPAAPSQNADCVLLSGRRRHAHSIANGYSDTNRHTYAYPKRNAHHHTNSNSYSEIYGCAEVTANSSAKAPAVAVSDQRSVAVDLVSSRNIPGSSFLGLRCQRQRRCLGWARGSALEDRQP